MKYAIFKPRETDRNFLFAVLLILSILTLSVLALKRRLCPKDVSDQEIETS